MISNTEIEAYRASVIKYVISLVPERFKSACANYLRAYSDISELRLRLNAPLSFTVNGGNLITGMKLSREDVQYTVDKITEGNYFKNEEIMRQGYVTLPLVLRAGICGDVFVASGTIKVLKTVNSINIRIPSTVLIDCDKIIKHIESTNFSTSILVFSPPGCGKTTLLRSITHFLSSTPYQKRVCVVDTNRELVLPYASEIGISEYLSGYPKSQGIYIATKYLNPEYIICDEIGGYDEDNAILETQHSGVPLIASIHCDTFSSLKLKKSANILLEKGVFDSVLRIKRNGKAYEYELKKVSDL